jgi:hypothetical protein
MAIITGSLTFKEPLRMRIQERILAALLPLLLFGVSAISLSEGDLRVALIIFAIGFCLLVVLEGIMGSPTMLVISPQNVEIYGGFYGRKLKHSCLRSEVSSLRVRRVAPFSILEFLKADSSVCLNTTTNWLSMNQLRQISDALHAPIANLSQAEVMSAADA